MSLIHKKNGILKHKTFQSINWTKITSIYYLIFVFGKSVLTLQKLICSFLLILVFAIGLSAMMPYYFSYGITTNLSLFLISSFIYGTICYSFHKSTLFDNIKETSLGIFDIYFSILVIVFVFSLIMYIFILTFFIVGLVVNFSLFTNNWFSSVTTYSSPNIMIGELNFELLVWWYIAYILINFSLFYLFQNIANRQTTFYLLIFFYFIFLLIFGNAVNVVTLNHEYQVVETYSFLDESSQDPNYSNYVEGVDLDLIFSIPNQNSPIEPSMQMSVSNSLKDQWIADRYFFSIATLVTPHYWINFYCTNVMKATSLTTTCLDPETTSCFPKLYNNLTVEDKINNYQTEITYSAYSFENIQMWTFSNEIAWILGMYLWIIYFIILAFVGSCFSKYVLVKRKSNYNKK